MVSGHGILKRRKAMSVRTVRRWIQVPGQLPFKYVTCDKQEFDHINEAIEWDNKFHAAQKKHIVYEQIWTVQEAINKAVAEKRVVRFLSNKTNAQLKKEIVDLKGCKLMKPDKNSSDVAVVPEHIHDFDFNEVDTSLEVKNEPD